MLALLAHSANACAAVFSLRRKVIILARKICAAIRSRIEQDKWNCTQHDNLDQVVACMQMYNVN